MCSPPNPAAISQFPQGAGVNNPAAPSSMKQTPMTGTTLTENIPPVTTPVPYNSNHMPGIELTNPARNKTTVNSAPTIIGGERLKTTLRPGPDNKGTPNERAFRSISQPAMRIEIIASANQTDSQPRAVD